VVVTLVYIFWSLAVIASRPKGHAGVPTEGHR
jgi:hypothetical protein